MSEWNLLPHEEATLLSIARDEALLSQEDHDYLPKAPEQADVFHPHEWVLEAIRRAYSMGRHAGAERARKEIRNALGVKP